MSATDPSFIATLQGAGSCLKCRHVLPRLVDCAPTYFESGYVLCGHCGEQVDVWRAALDKATRLSAVSGWALTSLGAAQTSFVLQMETGRHYALELTNYEVPADARILTRHYSSQGGEQGSVTAVEWHPNDPAHRVRGTLLPLLAVPVLEGPVPRVGPVGINIVWIRGEDSADAWPYLVSAFESAAARDYAPSMVFAQSAVEISMMPRIEQRLRRHASGEHVKRFMRNSLTYSYALNVVLPYLCGEAGLARMPDAVRGALNKMRRKRNDIIHEGAETVAVTAADAMEGLCAAAFGFEYMRYVAPALSGIKNDQ